MIIDTSPQISDLIHFFKKNKLGQEKFRYFKKRPFEVINNHKVTILIKEDNEILAYGHLDVDGENVWLGIMVSDFHKNKGVGTKMMSELINSYSGKIKLSVDQDNITAINLYKKFGFKEIDNTQNYIIMLKQ